MRVLAIGAHPDDLEILCGGTLARYAAEGHQVVMAHATDGARGGPEGTDPLALGAERDIEAAAAAAIAEAVHVNVKLPDAGLAAGDPGQREAIVALVRDVAPDVVITHHPDDYHGDHREVSRLVFTASFAAANPIVEGGRPMSAGVPVLLYLDTLAGLGAPPTEYVDISGFMATKRAMVSEHRSQLAYLQGTFGTDILDHIEVHARFRGLQAGVRHAEAFHVCRTWHRVRTTRVLP